MGESDALFQGEPVLWVGEPARVRVLDGSGMLWLGLGVFFTVLVGALVIIPGIASGGGPGLVLAVLFLVCVLGVVAAGLAQLRAGRRSTRYVLTDRRIVVTSRWFGQDRVQTAYLARLPPPAMSVSRGATVGTIWFGDGTDAAAAARAVSSLGQETPIVLRDIEDVRRVRDLIVSAQAGGR